MLLITHPHFTVAVERERDELLALLDVQERQRYEVTRSQSAAEEQAYNNFTSAEVNFCLMFCFFVDAYKYQTLNKIQETF